MDLTEQGRRAVARHSAGFEEGKTCIDCHKGIAHNRSVGSKVYK